MKKFEDLMNVKNEIENISASEAKEKLNDPNVQFIENLYFATLFISETGFLLFNIFLTMSLIN